MPSDANSATNTDTHHTSDTMWTSSIWSHRPSLVSLAICGPTLTRREEKLYVEGMEDEDMKKETQNLAYPPAFKLEVALFAKKHSQYAAAKIFNVARRRIFDWMRQVQIDPWLVPENPLSCYR